MKNIDFLPDVYRQRDSLRRARLWWIVVLALFGSSIGAAAIAQAWQRHELVEQLDALTSEFAGAQARVQELAALQEQVARAGYEASLFSLLENPWPRTQLLAEIVQPMKGSTVLTRLLVTEEEIARDRLPTAANNKSDEEAAEKRSPAEKDLARLADETQRRQTVIEVEGHTTDVPQLHEYVSQLSHSPLIATAAIKSLEATTTGRQSQTRFSLRLIVRPGHCQQTQTPARVVTTAVGRAGGGQ
jgi:hypothetical protein